MNFLAASSSRTIFDSLDITESTKQDYLSRLPQFLGFVHRNGITRDLLLDYKNHLRGRTDLGIASKNKYLAVARMALRELHRQGSISVDLSIGVKSFQQSSKHKVQGLNESEVETICEYLRIADDTFKNIRLRALIALLIFQGLRTVEVCRLSVNDIDIANGIIKVLGKGRDDKEPIPIHPETAKALTTYLKRSQVKDGALFYSLLCRAQYTRLTTRGLRLIIKGLFNRLEIDRTVHGCRHYYTTQLIQEYGSDLLAVARYTRHRSVEILKVYNDTITTNKDLPKYYATFRQKLSK